MSNTDSTIAKSYGFKPISEWEETTPGKNTSTRRSRVINRDYVKRWALDYSDSNRCHPFNRVSEQFLNAIEAATKAAIRDRIMRHPSKGKTLM